MIATKCSVAEAHTDGAARSGRRRRGHRKVVLVLIVGGFHALHGLAVECDWCVGVQR